MFLPNIIWPRELREAGPPFDPSIVLRGDAKIGTAQFSVIAVRMNQFRTGPDYRNDINEWSYGREMGDVLDALDYLIEVADPILLPLTAGRYFLWMVPEDNK